MTAWGTVLRRAAPGYCVVRLRRESACAGDCRSCTVCGDAPPIDVLARNPLGMKPGRRVAIESATGQTLRLAALVYLVPLVLFLAGYLFRPVAGAVGLLLGLGLAMAVNRRLTREGGVSVVIIAGLDDDAIDHW